MQHETLNDIPGGDEKTGRLGRRAALRFLAVASVTAAVAPLEALARTSDASRNVDAHAEAIRGSDLLVQGRYEEAAAVLTPAALAAPRDEWIWSLAGRAQFLAGRHREARESFIRVLRLNPADAQARMMLERIAMHPLPGDDALAVSGREGALERKAREEAWAAMDGHSLARLVIDPGHGGRDVGDFGLEAFSEKNVNFALAVATARRLRSFTSELSVFLTRNADRAVSASERARTAERLSAGLLVSVHCDAAIQSPEVYVWSAVPTSSRAAQVAVRENMPFRLESPALQRGGLGGLLSRALRQRWMDASFAMAETTAGGLGAATVQGADFSLLARSRVPGFLVVLPWPSSDGVQEWGGRLALALASVRRATAEVG